MTVSSENRRNDYIGNDATDVFSYSFKILDPEHLEVIERDADGVERTLILGTDYTISGVGDRNGGSITRLAGNLPEGYAITLRRKLPLLQETDLRNQGGYYPETVETALDRVTMQIQQHDDEIARSLKVRRTDAEAEPGAVVELKGARITGLADAEDDTDALSLGHYTRNIWPQIDTAMRQATEAANDASSSAESAREYAERAADQSVPGLRDALENGTQAVSSFSGGHYTGQASGNTLTISGTPVDELTGEPKFHVGRRLFCEGEARTITEVTTDGGNTVVTVDGAALSAGSVGVWLGASMAPQGLAIGQYYLPTTHERAAGVTVVDYRHPPLFVDRYGRNSNPGATDMSAAINAAIIVASEGGGGVVLFAPGAEYRASGIEPKSNVTLRGDRAVIKPLPDAAIPMIYYNDSATLERFNLIDLILDGDNIAQDIIHISEPSPSAPKKTWYDSVISRCLVINSGAIGLYCPIPGSVTIADSYFGYNDIGIAWDREHFYIRDTVCWSNRVGVRSTGNHFTCVNLVLAHNTEAGWTTDGAGLGKYNDVLEAAFLGCSFIDNGAVSLGGPLLRTRVIGCRMLMADRHITGALHSVLANNQMSDGYICAIDDVDHRTIVADNYIAVAGGGPEIGIRTANGAQHVKIANNTLYGMDQAIVWRGAHGGKTQINTIIVGRIGIVVESPQRTFVVRDNQIRSMSGTAILVQMTGPVPDWAVTDNQIDSAGDHGIHIAGDYSANGVAVSRNQVLNANQNDTECSAIRIEPDMLFSHIADNVGRNTTMQASYIVECVSSGTGVGTIFHGNVARNTSNASGHRVQERYEIGVNYPAVAA